jgi:putative resolvase
MNKIDKIKFLPPKKASEILGVHWMTLRNWSSKGKIETLRSPGGKRFYNVDKYLKDNNIEINDKNIEINDKNIDKKKICYCRVSSHSQKNDLENQIKYMKNKYPDYEILSDIGSGINFKRGNFNKILDYGINGELEVLVVSYKDRLCRIAFDLISNILDKYSKTNIIIENDDNKSSEEELVDDMLEIITVFSSRLYGMRSYKNNNE